MRDFTLGIIGGCLTHQAGVLRSELYHQRLKRQLAEQRGVNLKVRIARDFTKEHSARLDLMLSEHALDAVLIHVRNYYLGKSVFITKSVTDEEFRYHLHPFLFKPWETGWVKVVKSNFAGQPVILRRRNTLKNHSRVQIADRRRESEALDTAVEGMDLGARRFLGVSLRDLFFATGAFAGLDSWAVRDELQMLREAMVKCRRLGLPLIVLGPARRPSHYWIDRTCRKLDKRLLQFLSTSSVPYCSIPEIADAEGKSLYLPDGWHFSVEGHRYVADRLGRVTRDWLDAVS